MNTNDMETGKSVGERLSLGRRESAGRPVGDAISIGTGDDLDVAAGRCCPTCRHDLTPHNVVVWNAGYTVAMRRAQSDIRDAWEAGFTASSHEHWKQRNDSSYPIQRANPHGHADDLAEARRIYGLDLPDEVRAEKVRRRRPSEREGGV